MQMISPRRQSFVSNRSAFRPYSRHEYSQSVGSNELRTEAETRKRSSDLDLGSHTGVNWSALFKNLRPKQQHNSLAQTFQRHYSLNCDTMVALLEFVIIAISLVQLDLTFCSHHWRENRACRGAWSADCLMLPEGSPSAANCLRFVIVALSLGRAYVRFRCLWTQKSSSCPFQTRKERLKKLSLYALEIAYTVILPYPGLETFSSTAVFWLSLATAFRTICWRHLLYFPYPIHEKTKLVAFSDSMDFTYPEFVMKKVLDDDPLQKIGLISVLSLLLCSYLLRVLETLNGHCVWMAATAAETAGHFVCAELSLEDSLWFMVMTFLKVGYGDVVPKTQGGSALVACTGCVMVALYSMFFSIVVKKFQFSSMEARVHSFLFRRNLYAQKDLSAVMAVQATFRFNKSYRGSLIWHQQDGSSNHVYFRPLSARLPNEVKKKLYVSRFQTRLKEILKFNTDGDPINAFAKHIEVITAALGITLIEMTTLKKVYYRKSRILEERRRRVLHAASVKLTRSDLIGVAELSPRFRSPTGRLRSCVDILMKPLVPLSESAAPRPAPDMAAAAASAVDSISIKPTRLPKINDPPGLTTWQQRMQQRAEETMRLLQKIETDAKDIARICDSSGSHVPN